MSCSDAKTNDRIVIQGIIKSVAQTQQLDTVSQKNFKGSFVTQVSYANLINFIDDNLFQMVSFNLLIVIVVMEVDRLTKDAQHALRRTMEKYISTCRLILCCNSMSRVTPAIRSRCLGIRVAAPTIDEVSKFSAFA